jgi:hypothetical protein
MSVTFSRHLIVLLSALVLLPVAGRADDSSHDNMKLDLGFVGGYKGLDSDWKPADDERELGLQVDVLPPGWPIDVAFAVLYGDSSTERVALPAGGSLSTQSNTTEMNVGLKKYIEIQDSRWRPFLAGGASLLRGEIETESPAGNASDSGMGLGFWASGGTLYVMGGWFFVGGQVQYTQGDVKLFGRHLDAGGVHLDGLVGIEF